MLFVPLLVYVLVFVTSLSTDSYIGPLTISDTPRIFLVDNVFTPEECSALISYGESALRPAKTMDPSGNENAGNYRDSDTIGLYNSSEEIVQHFRSLMANLAMLPIENSEVLQLTRYTPGQKYGLHFDSSLNVGRVVTVLVFLDEVIEGGELVFPWAKLRAGVELDGVSGPGRNISDLVGVHVEPDIDAMCALDSGSLLIAPRVGRVALFYSHRPDLRRESYAAMHGGCRVTQGTKFIAQLWFDWSIFGNSNSNHIATIFQHVGMSQWQVNPTESVL